MALKLDPITGEMIEDGSPEQPVDLKAQVYQNLMKKYGLDSYSPEKRANLEEQSQIGFGDRAVAALGALGSGIAGKDAAGTGMSLLNAAKAEKRTALDDFDKRRTQAVSEIDLNQNLSKFEREENKISEMGDINSARSKSAQTMLIEDYGMDPSVANKLTAEQVEQRIPSLKFKLDRQLKEREMAERSQDRQLQREQKEIAREAAQAIPKKAQSDATGFGKRVEQAEEVFDALGKGGYDRSSISSGIGSVLPNVLKSSESQQQDQAERNFINAILRRESGAAIADSEFESAEIQYFPRAGDSPEVIAQKKANRQQQLNNLKSEAGSNYDKVELASPSKSGKITVSNGTDSFEIDESDLAEAEADGYKRI